MVTSKVESITPELAAEYLTHNSRNPRKTMNRSVIQKYADDIAAGLWELNGDSIVFDEDGFLKNGQHRLCAIIKAGKPVRTIVVRGVSRDTKIWDTQYRRTITQNVNADGNFSINSHISSAASIIVNNFGAAKGEGRMAQALSFVGTRTRLPDRMLRRHIQYTEQMRAVHCRRIFGASNRKPSQL